MFILLVIAALRWITTCRVRYLTLSDAGLAVQSFDHHSCLRCSRFLVFGIDISNTRNTLDSTNLITPRGHSFGTSCRLLHEPLVPTHWTASNEHWRRHCFFEWASCCRSQHLWGTFLNGGGGVVIAKSIALTLALTFLIPVHTHCFTCDTTGDPLSRTNHSNERLRVSTNIRLQVPAGPGCRRVCRSHGG